MIDDPRLLPPPPPRDCRDEMQDRQRKISFWAGLFLTQVLGIFLISEYSIETPAEPIFWFGLIFSSWRLMQTAYYNWNCPNCNEPLLHHKDVNAVRSLIEWKKYIRRQDHCTHCDSQL